VDNCGSRSFKVADFSTNRKLVCDFLLVSNTNLHPVSHRWFVITAATILADMSSGTLNLAQSINQSHRFQVIADYWQPDVGTAHSFAVELSF